MLLLVFSVSPVTSVVASSVFVCVFCKDIWCVDSLVNGYYDDVISVVFAISSS